MKRIWGQGSSLSERREGEAKLFEAGLRENGLLERLVALEEPGTTLEGVAEGLLVEQHDSVEDAVIDDADTRTRSLRSSRRTRWKRPGSAYRRCAGIPKMTSSLTMGISIDARSALRARSRQRI
jgi:hypothetical protein